MTARAEEYLKGLFENYCPDFDAYQIHFYQEWPYLVEVLDFIRGRMLQSGCEKPLQIWELGYGVDRLSDYSLEAHAVNVEKTINLALERGVKLVNYVTLFEKQGFARGLYNSDGNPRPALEAFKSAVNSASDL